MRVGGAWFGTLSEEERAAYISRREKERQAWWARLSEEEQEAYLSRILAGVRPHDTSIERAVANWLTSHDVTFEAQVPIGWYKVDFYVPDARIVIEVQGCYWHACALCGFEEYGRTKGVRKRDAQKRAYLARKGYTLIELWEHEIMDGTFESKLSEVLAA